MTIEATKQFDNLRDQNMMILKESKDTGKKTFGFYCTYAPQEIADAAGAYAVTLCGTKEEPIIDAEKDLPRNLCPLIKSSYGFAVSDKCPYFFFSDMIVGETTCDGKKKMYELMSGFKNVHIMQMLPNQSEQALAVMKDEIIRLKEHIQEVTGKVVSQDEIIGSIKLLNKERRTVKKLFDLNKNKPAVISGKEMLKVSWQSGFHLNRIERIHMIENLISELEKNIASQIYNDSMSTPRILLTGVPTGVGSDKIFSIVEECGGNIVVFENCTGYKTVDLLVDEKLAVEDPYLALAQRYIQIPCSIMSPNNMREEKLEMLAREFKVDAVIDLTWQACHTYNIEAVAIEKLVKEKLGLPYLHIETDYSSSDLEQLKVRVSALIEMI
ncbi:MAG: double-cubane-cluster-containing anaerobic reductase [Eubacteriales bacterium]